MPILLLLLWTWSATAAAPLSTLDAAVPLGLPALTAPADNLPTAARVALGRKLFFDRRLSFNGTLSCGMCHVPEQAFTQNELRTPVGIEGRFVKRNAPSLLNVAYRSRLFHDGRESSLEHQVWQPLLKSNEMANPSIGHVLETIRTADDYDGLFESAYGSAVSMEAVGLALASYQRSLLLADSAFDRWRYGGDDKALDPAARRGWSLFQESGCGSCHRIGERSALFADGQFHDTGIGYARSMGLDIGKQKIELVPGLEIAAGLAFGTPAFNDLGRYEATGRSEDRWRYLTPSLRNVALTSPYMHDGSLPDLRAVIDYYRMGGAGSPNQDRRIRPLSLSDENVAELEAFLRSLTGSGLENLQRDARSVPIGDVQ
ncbi:cytochrome-c peroxidase [Seongchinamella sediminis]|uniref:cytochrome-c peroxidase n=1 Tax=Seongchinamella sediminis TaxID=2283635 RepID=UPI001EF03FF7|nr:cytochrome c peroxidase [Seongchinamella sediminis]